jgi:hypothetical protein
MVRVFYYSTGYVTTVHVMHNRFCPSKMHLFVGVSLMDHNMSRDLGFGALNKVYVNVVYLTGLFTWF